MFSFIVSIWQAILNTVKMVLDFYIQHWKITVPLTIYVISMVFIWNFQGSRTEARVNAKWLAEYNQRVAETNKKIKDLEDISVASADQGAENNKKVETALDQILAEAKKNKKPLVTIVNGECKPAPAFIETWNAQSNSLKLTTTLGGR